MTRLLVGLILLGVLSACAPESGVQEVQVSSGPDGTATLTWTPGEPFDASVTHYMVHYGTASPGVVGSCDYQEIVTVEAPQTTATVTGLPPGIVYYFAVSAYNGLESLCSEEVSFIDQ